MKQLNIIKIGGNIIDDPVSLKEFLHAFANLEGHKLLVHGGGKIATQMADSLQIKTEMVEGRRITDDAMLEVVTMTYGGLINKKIVSQLQSLHVNALGLTGADGNLILSEKRKKTAIDYGWVGDPGDVNGELLLTLMNNGLVPVIAPLTHDGKGNLLNTNADTIASVIGVALSAFFETSINYCFELNGVLLDIRDSTSLVKELSSEKYATLKARQKVSHGMIPKLDNAFEAISKGVKRVRIMHHRSIANLQNKNYDEYTTIH